MSYNDYFTILTIYIYKPLTVGPEYIRFLHVLLAHYIPDFKHVKDKK